MPLASLFHVVPQEKFHAVATYLALSLVCYKEDFEDIGNGGWKLPRSLNLLPNKEHPQ